MIDGAAWRERAAFLRSCCRPLRIGGEAGFGSLHMAKRVLGVCIIFRTSSSSFDFFPTLFMQEYLDAAGEALCAVGCLEDLTSDSGSSRAYNQFRANQKKDQVNSDINKFLNRLLGLHVKMQGEVRRPRPHDVTVRCCAFVSFCSKRRSSPFPAGHCYRMTMPFLLSESWHSFPITVVAIIIRRPWPRSPPFRCSAISWR